MAAHVPTYATADDLLIPAKVIAAVQASDPNNVQKALNEASAIADSYFTKRYTLPFQPLPGMTDPTVAQVSADITDAVAAIATYRLLRRRGFQPDGKQAEEIRGAYKDAIKWLTDVVASKVDVLCLDASMSGGTPFAPGPIRQFVVQAYPASMPLQSDDADGSYLPRIPGAQDDFGNMQGTLGPPTRRGW